MYLSLDWLKDFVDIPKNVTPEELGKLLTTHTVEIDSVLKEEKKYENIIIGQILLVEKHPNADKLQLATVNTGSEELRIVCGAPNIAPGQKVPVALVGAVLPNGLTIKETEIRGVKSVGMLCAEDELGLGNDHAGILILDSQAKVGLSFGKYLKLEDVIFEVDNKSITNRPDLWGHFGMAREIGAFLGKKLKPLNVIEPKEDSQSDVLAVSIEDTNLCSRYMAVVMDNIKVKESPAWMQKRLLAVGVRPISNIVDITNYVMMELGQPLHAFDAQALRSSQGENNYKIVVRPAKTGEQMKTLDGVQRHLNEEMLLIADEQKPLAIAGIMGGENSEISDETTKIIIESANFNFVSIRKTSMKLGLRSEASQRFEKSLDPNLCEQAIKRVIELVKETNPQAKMTSLISDNKSFSLDVEPIKLSVTWLNNFLGLELTQEKISGILSALGFSINQSDDALLVSVPSWRATKDVSRKEDLAEEIARIIGYDNLTPVMPLVVMEAPEINQELRFVRKIRDVLSSAPCLSEVFNYSFVGEEQLKVLGIDSTKYLRLLSPVVKQHTLCRQNLATNLFNNIKTNQARFEEVGLFEIGSIYSLGEGGIAKSDNSSERLPFQEKRLGMILGASGSVDVVLKLKGMLQFLMEKFDLEISFVPMENSNNWSEPGFSAQININNVRLGTLDLLSRKISQKIGIKKKTACLEISLPILFKILLERNSKAFVEFEKFPASIRDLAFVINKKVLYNDIRKEILEFNEYIKSVELFDSYEGEKLGPNKKSLAFHVVYQTNKTLTAVEVDEIQVALFKRLEERFEARVRDF